MNAPPSYVIPFDARGSCTAPKALDELLKAASAATDVFVFAHGWNNDWPTALARYEAFTTRFTEARTHWWRAPDRPYAPVLAGIFWPSTILLTPGERAPEIAAEDGTPVRSDVDELAWAVAVAGPPGAADRLRALAARDTLDDAAQHEFAALLSPALSAAADDLDPTPPDPADLLSVWRRLPPGVGAPAAPADQGGFIPDGAPPDAVPGGGPRAAGLGLPDPRDIVRAATVLLMKDRAGRVGGNGVSIMLRRLIEASSTSRLHLVGHSYGAKVVLSALCNGPPPVRDVESALLLQPAVSALCFAADADGKGTPGGYRTALTRVRQPVVTTYSSHDVPLTRLFQWAVRRASDLGEARIAGTAPSRYAALGGYGPQGTRTGETAWVDALAPDRRYTVAAGGPRLVAIRGDQVISGHGDVTTPATAWALLCQVMG
ncbi:MAG TPA: hypothetical protein VGL93_13225 [Streptosporangiaceae bacterium]|jgi:hypothetical protein